MSELKKRSQIFLGGDPTARGHRALLYSLGFSREQVERPLVAVVNTW